MYSSDVTLFNDTMVNDIPTLYVTGKLKQEMFVKH